MRKKETNKSTKGLIQVYTGDGKGKTTAALGLALRAAGQGLKVIMVQFVKSASDSGEHKFLSRYHPFELVQLNTGDSFTAGKEELQQDARKTMDFVKKTLAGGDYDMVILDEIFIAITRGLIPEQELLELMEKKPEKVELVLTGRKASFEVVKRADLVSEILMIKHPYKEGVPARKGIEY